MDRIPILFAQVDQNPPLSVRAGTARCSLLGEMTEMGSCSSATARTRRPVPAARRCPEAPAATAGGKVLTSVTVTPGKSRGLRQEPGGQAAAAKPGRGVPVNAAVTRPSSFGSPGRPGPGRRCFGCSARPRRALLARQRGRSVPGAGGAERGAARSGAAGPAGEPGWRAAGRCPA